MIFLWQLIRDDAVSEMRRQIPQNGELLKMQQRISSLESRLETTKGGVDAQIRNELNVSLQHMSDAFEQELNLLSTQLAERQKMEKNLSARLDVIEMNLGRLPLLQRNLDDLNARMNRLEKETPRCPPSIPTEPSEIVQQLQHQMRQQQQINQQLWQRLSQVEQANASAIEQADKRIQELTSKIEEQNKEIKGLADKIENPQIPTTPENDLLPVPQNPFHLPKSKKVFFAGNPTQIQQQLAKIFELDDVMDFLHQSSFEKKDNFIRNIARYERDLKRFTEKLDLTNYDEEELSEELTDKFFKIVQQDILSNLMIAIYRGMKDAPAFYSAFLEKMNAYLKSCNIYTRDIQLGCQYQDKDLDDMLIIEKKTGEKEKNRIIEEVERLPYYMDYQNEDNETEALQYDGKMVVLMYAAD